MTSTLYPLTLDGNAVRLEALSLDHVEGLVAAAGESRDTYGLTQVPADREHMVRYVESALLDARREQGVPFATVDKRAGRVVGSTRFGTLERWPWPGAPVEPVALGPDAVEIGRTWPGPRAPPPPLQHQA